MSLSTITEQTQDLISIIENLREEMIRTSMREGLSSDNTLRLSQTLDEYLVKYQTIEYLLKF